MSLQDMWNSSKGVENQELVDGLYTVKVLSCKTTEAKNSGLPKFEWEAEIVSGPQKGKMWIHRVMDSTKQFTIDKAKQDFISLGYEPEFAKMKSIMADVVGKLIEVKLSTNNKDFQDKTIVKFVETPAANSQTAAPQSPPETAKTVEVEVLPPTDKDTPF